MSDYAEDLAHEAGRPGPESEDLMSEREFAQMLRQDRVYFEPRRSPLTEQWLMDQEDARRAAVRDLDRSFTERLLNALGYLFVVGVGLVLLAGVAYASALLWKALSL